MAIVSSVVVTRSVRERLYAEILKIIPLRTLLEQQTSIFRESVPLKSFSAAVIDRAALILEQVIREPDPWKAFVRRVLEEFWKFIVDNICDEEECRIVNVRKGVALQICYPLISGTNDREFNLQHHMYKSSFMLMASVLLDPVMRHMNSSTDLIAQNDIIQGTRVSLFGFHRTFL